MTQQQENEIIRRVLQGDTDAYELLVLEHQKSVYNIALRTVGNAEDAADITQDALIKAYSSLSSFRGDSKFSVWLYRITVNLCRDLLRSRSRRPTVSLTVEDDAGEDTVLDTADPAPTPEEQLERRETREAVRRGLDSLPPDHREILLLREVRGMSYDEIAEALSIETGTVKSRIFRARKKLCAFLTAEGNISEFSASVNIGGGGKP